MKKLLLLAVPAIVLASCSGDKTGNKAEELAKLKKQKADIELKIKALEGDKKEGGKITPVSIVELKPAVFNAFIEVQSQVTGDANVVATAKAPGTVQAVLVQPGQSVSAGQVLATLDASTIDHQIETLIPTLNLQKSVYEKQQNLWKENIGTEVQLMSSKAQYESTQKQIAALKSQKDLYRIVARFLE
jgi:membrane fusion protein (multidrug efflux system)